MILALRRLNSQLAGVQLQQSYLLLIVSKLSVKYRQQHRQRVATITLHLCVISSSRMKVE